MDAKAQGKRTEKMMNGRKVKEFVARNGLYYGDISFDRCCSDFMDEMQRGLDGKESSLRMLPTYIEVEGEIPPNEPIIALDAGGTNFRVAVVYFDEDKKPHIDKHRVYEMPGVGREVGKEEFFHIIAEYLGPVKDESSRIGFCFSYPTEILPNRDGKLVYFSKEIQASEVIGELIGRNLIAALKSNGGGRPERIVLLNDTVATLLAGKASFSGRKYDGYIGYILGTGNNCCYVERNANIGKQPDLNPDVSQVINIESGNFSRAPRGSIDLNFDGSTINPGFYTYEKMISGAYFGGLCSACIEAAATEGIFSRGFCRESGKIGKLDTRGVNVFMESPRSAENPLARALRAGTEDDAQVLYHLVDSLIWRSALLAAVPLASVMMKSGRGSNPCSPVCITAEGSVFYGLRSLRRRTETFLEEFASVKNGRYFELVNVDNAALIGAAIAGLIN